jgi:hypothetical protein
MDEFFLGIWEVKTYHAGGTWAQASTIRVANPRINFMVEVDRKT